MPSTYVSLHYHAIFSTKTREPFIDPSLRPRLHAYLGGIVRSLEGASLCVGGTADHVHLLFGLKATHCLADVVRDVKKSASQWVHEEWGRPAFAWQEGYAAFTVSPTALRSVTRYISNQESHHQKRGFREELVEFLEKAGVEYEPKYLD